MGTRSESSSLNRIAEQEFDPERPTIVYAEDDPDLLHQVHDLLRDRYNLYLAVDGRDALERVKRVRPDLVITDQRMPNMSGRELLQAIRDDADIRATPVIFLTARDGSEARIESLNAGADDYLTKPFHFEELLARIHNLIRARRQERELADLNRRLEARVSDQMGELVRTGQLKQFLPPALAESLLSGELDARESFERRRITALAAVLSGVEELGEGLEPEELSELVGDLLREVTAAVVTEAGTVQTAGLDGVIAIFGAPSEMEPSEQAAAAARAAIRMRDALDEIGVRWARRGVTGCPPVRAGLATGYATVGVFGSELQRSYSAVGTVMTTARRLAEEAAAGEILMATATHALTEGFRSAPRGEYRLNGVARPVDAFELLALPDDDTPGPQRTDLAPMFLPK